MLASQVQYGLTGIREETGKLGYVPGVGILKVSGVEHEPGSNTCTLEQYSFPSREVRGYRLIPVANPEITNNKP